MIRVLVNLLYVHVRLLHVLNKRLKIRLYLCNFKELIKTIHCTLTGIGDSVAYMVAVNGDVADVVELQQTIVLSWLGFRRQSPCLLRRRAILEHRQRLGLHGNEAAVVWHHVSYSTQRNDLLSRPVNVVHLQCARTDRHLKPRDDHTQMLR